MEVRERARAPELHPDVAGADVLLQLEDLELSLHVSHLGELARIDILIIISARSRRLSSAAIAHLAGLHVRELNQSHDVLGFFRRGVAALQ